MDYSKLTDQQIIDWVTEVYPSYKKDHAHLEDIPAMFRTAQSMAEEYNVDTNLLLGILKVESDFGKKSTDNIAQVLDLAMQDLDNLGYDLSNKDTTTIEGSIETAAAYLSLTKKRLKTDDASRIGTAYFTGAQFLIDNPDLTDEIYAEQTSSLERARKVSEAMSLIGGSGDYKPDLSSTGGVQEALKSFGYYTSVVDGIAGEGTKAAIESFQEAIGIDVTGELDEVTKSRLQLKVDKSYKAPKFTLEQPVIDMSKAKTYDIDLGMVEATPDAVDIGDLEVPEVPLATPSTPEETLEGYVVPEIEIEANLPESRWSEESAFVAEFVEGVLGGWDVFDNESAQLTPFWENTANIGGSIANALGLVSVSGGIVGAIKGTKYLGSALKFGGKGLSLLTSGAAQGAVYTGLDYLTSPEDLRPTAGDLGINMLQFGVGDVARSFATTLGTKLKLKEPIVDLMGYVADTVGGASAALAMTKDLTQFKAETIGIQAIAIGAVDVLLNAYSRGKLKASLMGEMKKTELKEALQFYMDNPADVLAQEAVFGKLQEFWTQTAPSNFSSMGKFIEEVNKLDTNDINKAIASKGEIEVKPEPPKEITTVGNKPTSIEPVKRVTEDSTGEIVPKEFKSEQDASLFDLGQQLVDGVLDDFQKNYNLETIRENLGLKDDFDLEDFLVRLKETVEANKGAEVPQLTPQKVTEIFDPQYFKGKGEGANKGQSLEGEQQTISSWNKLQKEILDGIDVNKFEEARLNEVVKPSNGFTINTTKMGGTGDVKKQILKIADFVDAEVPRVKLKEVEAKATVLKDELGLQGNIDVLKKALVDAPETITAYRGVIVDNAKSIKSLTDSINSKRAKGIQPSELELAQFLHLTEMQRSMITDYKSIARNVSASLNAGRIKVGANDFSDISDITLAQYRNSFDAQAKTKDIIDAYGGVDEVLGMVKKYEGKVGTTKELNKQVLTTKSKLTKAFLEFRSANLLSPWTVAKNIIAQTANMLNEAAVNYSKALVTLPFKGVDRMTFKQANARLVGNMVGLLDAFKPKHNAFKDVLGLHYDKLPSNFELLWMRFAQPKKYEQLFDAATFNSRAQIEGYGHRMSADFLRKSNPGDSKVIDTLWNVFDFYGSHRRLLSFGLLEKTDRPFFKGAFTAEATGQVQRLVDLGVLSKDNDVLTKVIDYQHYKTIEPELKKAAAQQADPKKWFYEKLQEIYGYDIRTLKGDTNVMNVYEAALKHANDMTWKSPSSNESIQKIEKVINNVPALKAMIPFFHTGSKIWGKWAYSSGLRPKFYQDLIGKNGFKAKEEALGRFTVSAMLYGLGAMLYANRVLTPTPRDSDERRRMYEAGLQPNSVKIGNTWVDYNVIDPAPALFFAAVAEVARNLEERDVDETALETVSEILFGVMRNSLSKTWMTGVNDAIEALMDEEKGHQYLQTTLGTLNPLRGVNRVAENVPAGGLNPFYQDKLQETYLKVKQGLPRLDSYGKPVIKFGDVFGLRTSKPTTSTIRQELANLGYSLSPLVNRVANVKITDQMYYDMIKSLDTKFHAEDTLNQLVSTPSYQRATPEQKKLMISNVYNKLKQAARQSLMQTPEYQELYKEYLKNKQSKFEAQEYNYDWFSKPQGQVKDSEWLRGF